MQICANRTFQKLKRRHHFPASSRIKPMASQNSDLRRIRTRTQARTEEEHGGHPLRSHRSFRRLRRRCRRGRPRPLAQVDFPFLRFELIRREKRRSIQPATHLILAKFGPMQVGLRGAGRRELGRRLRRRSQQAPVRLYRHVQGQPPHPK